MLRKVSIIIPVYNAEEHLAKCINSVLSQTEKNIEIILIDDGSQDSSLDICQNYAKQDERIRVIHQDNAGVSAARNQGLEVASGEYLGFVDSDDWIEKDMYERLLNEAEKNDADVVMCDAKMVYSDGEIQVDTITQLSCNYILKKSDFTPALLLEMAGSAWRCIYKNNRFSNELSKAKRVQFPPGIKFSEDRIFNLYAMGYANKIVYIKEAYYNRYMNEKSAVHRFHEDYFEICKEAACEIEKAIFWVWDDNPEHQRAYLNQLIDGALMAICNYYYKTSHFNSHERRAAVKNVCGDLMLQNAIKQTGLKKIQAKWILKKRINLLIMYANLANLKHKR